MHFTSVDKITSALYSHFTDDLETTFCIDKAYDTKLSTKNIQ